MILQNILWLCKERQISLAKLEKEIGLGNATISRWGVSSPTVENVRKVADFFGVTVDQLINDNRAQEKETAPDIVDQEQEEVISKYGKSESRVAKGSITLKVQ